MLTLFPGIIAPTGRMVIHVEWELSVIKISGRQCKCTNRVATHATEDRMQSLEHQVILFDLLKALRQPVSIVYSLREKPLFAAGMECAALTE